MSPSGLAREWSYTSPDGANVLIGESALVAHALKSGLLVESENVDDVDKGVVDESSASEEVGDVEVAEAYEKTVSESSAALTFPVPATQASMDEAIRVSQIDTSAQLSQ
ncbi:hypothetical protein PInf_015446 [Phytophthora infestans]|nr:hypothetical protein PInf_015446 [Phytophthora infestans]